MIRPVTFQTKLTVVYLGLFLAVQGVVLGVFGSSVPGRVRGEIEGQLAASARVCERIIDGRVQQLASGAQLLARDFGFRDAVASADGPTVLSALRNQQARIGADFAVAVDLDGEVIAAIDGDRVFDRVPALPAGLKLQAETDGTASRILVLDGRLHELVLVPVAAPVTIAWIGLGVELDAQAAREFKSLFPLALDIAFLHRQGGGPWRLASSSSADLAPGTALPDLAAGGGAFADRDHLYRLLPLDGGAAESEAAALLSYPMATALAPYRNLVLTLLAVLALGLALLAVGGSLVSRNVTRPLRDLAAAARQIAAGDYREVSGPTRDVELADLTASFNLMVGAVKEREERILYQAAHDAGTGLPNRLAFAELLLARAESGGPFAVLLAEVQELPELRTVLNHANVDELMGAVGERLHRVTDAEVARLSTETFALILAEPGDADVMASIVRHSFLTPFTLAGVAVDAAVRIGLVQYPRDGAELPLLLRHAHSALDRARTAPDGTAWYDPDSDSSHARRLSLMSELRRGLAAGEVGFAYQPKYDLALGRVTAVEALVRWHSPTRGYVPPDEFIPLAERTGDVRLLTEWGLGEAVRQAAAWRAEGLDLTVAVNISAADLLNRDMPGLVHGLLRRYDLPAARLQLEVTESAVMQDADRALDVLGMLAAMGLGLAIDDFGTGYSSLGYLKRLPVRELKIDRSFVTNLATSEEDSILVRSTIELGHNLGLVVTAEGVEDEATVQKLRAYRCDMLQGYHLGRPLPPAELARFLEQTAHV